MNERILEIAEQRPQWIICALLGLAALMAVAFIADAGQFYPMYFPLAG